MMMEDDDRALTAHELPDEILIQAAARDLAQAPSLDLSLSPGSAFFLIGLVQLALRHPNVRDSNREAGEKFVAIARQHFGRFPYLVELIRRGDDPGHDVKEA